MNSSEDIYDDEEPDDESDNDESEDGLTNINELDNTSLDTFLFYIIKKLDANSKRFFISTFLEVMGAKDRRDPFGMGSRVVRVELSKDSEHNTKELAELSEIIFFRALSKKQKELYNLISIIKFFSGKIVTAQGYIDLLNSCNTLARITGLPFSLEDKYGGLKDWDEWNSAIEKALKEGRKKFGR